MLFLSPILAHPGPVPADNTKAGSAEEMRRQIGPWCISGRGHRGNSPAMEDCSAGLAGWEGPACSAATRRSPLATLPTSSSSAVDSTVQLLVETGQVVTTHDDLSLISYCMDEPFEPGPLTGPPVGDELEPPMY